MTSTSLLTNRVCLDLVSCDPSIVISDRFRQFGAPETIKRLLPSLTLIGHGAGEHRNKALL